MNSGLRVLLFEPFYGGSHKRWADDYVSHSSHDVVLRTLSDAHWKWRMHGAAVSFVNQVEEVQPDVVLCSSMMDVATFRGLLNNEAIPVVSYFHENQLEYPFQGGDERDRHYGFINYTTALASDLNVFNSKYNRDSFIGGLTKFLKAFPDHQNLRSVDEIKQKSEVVYPGLESDKFNHATKKVPGRILWNHRWEHDKGPDRFLNLLNTLKERSLNFELVLLGEQYERIPDAMSQVLIQHADRIVHHGWLDNEEQYLELVASCAVLPVTSMHEFYGYSVLEAILSGCKPVLPNALVYPEYANALPRDCYYSTDDELVEKVIEWLHSVETIPLQDEFVQTHNVSQTSALLDGLIARVRPTHQ